MQCGIEIEKTFDKAGVLEGVFQLSAFEQVFRVLSETLNQPTSHMFILVKLGYQPR
jgi:hypothetical protein